MNKIRNSSMFLLWGGAAISLAEIFTGGLLAPLGFAKGLTAILIGHLIGGILLSLGGYISFRDKKSAMDKVRDCLGPTGVKIVAFLNVLQLLGWSAVMIIQGARGINSSLKLSYSLCLLIMALLVFLWSYFFENKSKLINDGAVLILFILVAIIFLGIGKGSSTPVEGTMSFMTAVELSIAMPVSWLPLIGDYTMKGESGKGVFFSSFLGYFFASCAMYVLGLAVSLYAGTDIITFISTSTVSIVACAIIVLSTVTTTFLDIFSAVESSRQLFDIKNSNRMVALYCLLALVISIFFPIEKYEHFLLIIGSVFVPVYTVVFTEYFINPGRKSVQSNLIGIFTAVAGCLLSNYFTHKGIFIPAVLTIIFTAAVYLLFKLVERNISARSADSESV